MVFAQRRTRAEIERNLLSPKRQNGGIAQLGERLHGMQEVSGSIPLTSTKKVASVSEWKDNVPFV
jgi:hypothetical protein